MTTDILHFLSVELDSATPPERLRIFKKGENDTQKGVFLFDEKAAEALLAKYQRNGVELSFDYDHAMVKPDSSPLDRVAAGWYGLEMVDGELWAVNIRWTPRARKAIEDREWRYTSPAFLTEGKTGRIKSLLNVALTNLPASVGMEPIAAHAIDADTGSTEENEMTKPAEPSKGELIVLTGADSEDAARVVVLGWKSEAEKVPALQKEIEELKVLNAKTIEERDGAVLDAVVLEALSDGRIVPAQRETLVTLHKKSGIDAVRAAVELLPKKSNTRLETPNREGKEGDLVTLSAEELEIQKKYGFTDAALIAARKKG